MRGGFFCGAGSKLPGVLYSPNYPSWVTVEYTAITIKGFRVRVSVFDALNLCDGDGAIGLQSAPMGKCGTNNEENPRHFASLLTFQLVPTMDWEFGMIGQNFYFACCCELGSCTGKRKCKKKKPEWKDKN